MANQDLRFEKIQDWLKNDLQLESSSIQPASSDASFRRYFRTAIDSKTYIIMDAPPDREDLEPFLHVTRLLSQSRIKVPIIYHENIAQGFLMIEDFGNTCLLDVLTLENAPGLYGQALETLFHLQQRTDIASSDLPDYDYDLLNSELELFKEWFAHKLLGINLTKEINHLLDRTWALLIQSALEQPRVCVHRDYHSRNLMHQESGGPGVIDFQDAVIGPVTYDLVSLLRDCYIAWPADQVADWVRHYYQNLSDAALINCEAERFERWFDLMGMQRHLKAIGIFSRLHIRDGKPGYLKDIPRTMNYVTDVCNRYPELSDFSRFLNKEILPVDHLAL